MKRLLPSLLLILLGLFLVPGFLHPGHASSTGLVCLADPAAVGSLPANPCPVSPGAVFDGPLTSPTHQIRMGVFVNGSAGFSAFDVALQADSTVLKPAGIDLSGSVLTGQLLILLKCLGGVNFTNGNCGPASTSDTLRVAVASFAGPTPSPTTGLLFTAIYNITAKTTGRIPMNFLSGCTSSSVAGTTVCATFANGSQTAVPETVQGAFFDNSVSIPYLTITTTISTLGPITSGSTQSLRLNLTGQNGWNLIGCPCPATIFSAADPSLRVVFNTTRPSVPSTGSVFVNMNVSGTAAGNYTVTVYAQYSSIDAGGNSDTLVAHTTVQVRVSDFALSTSPLGVLPTLVGSSSSFSINVMYENGFVGSVSLTDTSPAALTCGAISPATLTSPGTATVSCTANTANDYPLALTGTSGSLTHSTIATFSFDDFSLQATSPSGQVNTSLISTVSLLPVNGFTGSVTLTDTVPSGLTCGSISPGAIAGSGTASLTCSATVNNVYLVTITGSYGAVVHSTTASFILGDFNITAISPSPVVVGVAATITATVGALNGFTRTVTLTTSAPSSLSCNSISPGTLAGSGAATVACSAQTAGNYTLTITGVSGPLSHTFQVVIIVQDYAVSVSPTSVTVAAGSSADVNFTVTSLNGFNQLVSISVANSQGLTITPLQATLLPPKIVSIHFVGGSVGTYNVTITLSSAPVTHSVSVQVRVTVPAAGSSTLFGLAPLLFYSLVGVVVVGVVATLGFFVVRGRRKGRAVARPVVKGSGRKRTR